MTRPLLLDDDALDEETDEEPEETPETRCSYCGEWLEDESRCSHCGLAQ